MERSFKREAGQEQPLLRNVGLVFAPTHTRRIGKTRRGTETKGHNDMKAAGK